MRKNRFAMVIIILNFLSNAVIAQSNAAFSVTKIFHIQSGGGWDYLAVSPVKNELYISHGTQVNILDKNTGDSTGIIPNTIGVHGIAFSQEFNKGFTSNGRLNNVTVFDLQTHKILDSIKTGENPDAIMFDQFSKKIITCNGRSKSLSVIDPISDKVVASIALDGKPETAVSDDIGNVYVNIEDKNEIALIDMKTFSVVTNWSIAPGESPSGLAIDKKTKRLFAGCDNEMVVVINAETGKVDTTLPIKQGCDGTGFDTTLHYIYASCGEGFLAVIKEGSADDYSVIANVPTKKSARTLAVDQTTHHVFLSAADLEENTVPGTRPKMIPGSFQILIVAEKK